MAWKGRPSGEPEFDQIKNVLSGSGLKAENPSLYQVVQSLIGGAQFFKDKLQTAFIKGVDKINLANQVTGVLPVANGGGLSGLYLPDFFLDTNVTAAGGNPTGWYRVGDVVTVFGDIFINPTATGLVQVSFTLPILSYFYFNYHLAGTAACPAMPDNPAIYADIVNYRAVVEFISTFTGQQEFFFTLSYRLIAKP